MTDSNDSNPSLREIIEERVQYAQGLCANLNRLIRDHSALTKYFELVHQQRRYLEEIPYSVPDLEMRGQRVGFIIGLLETYRQEMDEFFTKKRYFKLLSAKVRIGVTNQIWNNYPELLSSDDYLQLRNSVLG